VSRMQTLIERRLSQVEMVTRRIAQIETKPRLIIPPGGGSGSKIFFEVDSAVIAGTSSPYNGKMILTVTIIVAPCDQSSLIDTSVDVVDWSTCLANAETTSAVVGREGWAFRGIAHSLKAGDPANTLTPCHWALDGLCCPP
jgi:hypothetical protein